MAEYGRIGLASDYGKDFHAAEPAVPARPLLVQKKVTRTTTFDFGRGPYTVEQMRDFAEELKSLPPGAKLSISYGGTRDEEWFKITVTEA